MRILVTGAAGFIGSRVTMRLLGEGHSVVGVDSLNDAYDPRIKESRLRDLQSHHGLTFHQTDISDRDEVGAIVRGSGAEAIINLAARAGVRRWRSFREDC